jgi:hypothetical protein
MRQPNSSHIHQGDFMRIGVIVSAGLLLAGCVSIDTTNKSRVTSVSNEVATATAVGENRTAKLGESMITVRNYSAKTSSAEVMEVSEDFRLKGFDNDRDFAKGDKLTIVGERNIRGVNYTIARPSGWYIAVQIAPDGSLTPALINEDIEMVWKVTAEPATVRFKRVPISATTTSGTGLNYDLAYNGVDGQSMKFQYREYKASDLDRPVISQDFAFPVGTKQVEFKGLSFDVQSATATQIAYSVRTLLPAGSAQAQSPAPSPLKP